METRLGGDIIEVSQWYWIILVIWALFYGYGNWSDDRFGRLGAGIVMLVLFILIGLQVMGKVVK